MGTVAMVAAIWAWSSSGEAPPGDTRRSLSEVEAEGEQAASHRHAQASSKRIMVIGTRNWLHRLARVALCDLPLFDDDLMTVQH
ncbi:hypothetical protein GCM10027214_25320 [Stenotrophomonas tumulicola]